MVVIYGGQTGQQQTKPETGRLLKAAKYFLEERNFTECCKYASLARDSDPTHPAPTRILSIAAVLSVSRISFGHHDYYAVLNLPCFESNVARMGSSFQNLVSIVDPKLNPFPFSSEAFDLVTKAWLTLSNPVEKAKLDDELRRVSSGCTYGSGGGTFWTMCPYCYYVYEYDKVFEDCCLKCANERCRRVLHAVAIRTPPPPDVVEKGQYWCPGFMPFAIRDGKGEGIGGELWVPFALTMESGTKGCDVNPFEPAMESGPNGCDVNPFEPAMESRPNGCDVNPFEPAVESGPNGCDINSFEPAMEFGPNGCDVNPFEPAMESGPNGCDVNPFEPAMESGPKRCDVNPFEPAMEFEPATESGTKGCDVNVASTVDFIVVSDDETEKERDFLVSNDETEKEKEIQSQCNGEKLENGGGKAVENGVKGVRMKRKKSVLWDSKKLMGRGVAIDINQAHLIYGEEGSLNVDKNKGEVFSSWSGVEFGEEGCSNVDKKNQAESFKSWCGVEFVEGDDDVFVSVSSDFDLENGVDFVK